MTTPQKSIIVCGKGFAASMTALALANGLGDRHKVVLIQDVARPAQDVLYGSVTAPTGYDFYRTLGLDEPNLFLNSSTAFSFGTHFQNWPAANRDWMQCHQQPLPVLAGVPLQHHLVRNRQALEPLLIAAIAARKNKFAHPPEDPTVPLSRAEYGYQFSVAEWTSLLQAQLQVSRVDVRNGQLASVETDGERITLLKTRDGNTLSADLVVDCTGTDRICLRSLGAPFQSDRSISVSSASEKVEQLGAPCRTVTATIAGWTSQTHLQTTNLNLTVTHAPSAPAPNDAAVVDCELGRVTAPWIGNCVAIGHAASVIEPLTPAPMMQLQRDIERLLELIPVKDDMSAECREFNRRFNDDVVHAQLFGSALFASDELPSSAYWSAAKSDTRSTQLARKLAQFESRGLLVKFDLEPFNDEDWTILHNGMGRLPRRYDLQVERAPATEIQQQLIGLKQAVEQMVARMPPHHLYVANMKRYLARQQNA